jgi:hypothetical protein
VKARSQKVAAATVGALLIGVVVVAAVREDGFRADHVTLHDNSVWVSNATGQVGRFNYDLQLVDTKSLRFDPISDLHQAGSTMVVETSSSRMFSYNVALNRADGTGNVLPQPSVLSVGGENGALLDAVTGKLWFTDRSGVASVVVEGPKETPGSLVLEGADDLIVGTDGTAHVIDADGRRQWRFVTPFAGLGVVPPGPREDLGDAATTAPDISTASAPATPLPSTDPPTALAIAAALEDGYQATTAGGELVVLTDGVLVREDGSDIQLPAEIGAGAVLQQPSPRSGEVLVASDHGLASISLENGTPSVLVDRAASDAVQPVWLDGCAYGAWSDAVFSSCSEPVLLETAVPPGSRFRTNRNRVVLNFADGSLIAFPRSEQMVPIDNTWADALDPAVQEDDTLTTESEDPNDRENACEVPTANRPPVASGSTSFTVRTGQSTTLDVLNPPGADSPASDPDCDVLTVALDPEAAVDPEQGLIAVVNEGRALQLQPSEAAAGDPIEIGYFISDGSPGGTVRASAQVSVIAADAPGSPPTAKPDQTTVEMGQTVVIDVLANDVDPDGDAISVKQVVPLAPGDGTLVWQPSGRVAFTAPGAGAGTKSVEYIVADDHGLQGTGTLEINVISAGVRSPPNPRSDSVLAMYTPQGAPSFDVNVLLNDSDPNGDALRLTEVVPYPAGGEDVKPTFDDDGTVTITPGGPGSYNFVYTVVDGDGDTAEGRLRFEVLDDRGRVPPVAVRDAVVVSSIRPTVVDVLRNDTDLNDDVLMVSDLDLPDVTADDLNVEILENRYLRVSTRRGQPGRASYAFSYTVSDGEQSSSATVAVGIVPGGGIQPPVTVEDRAQVHLGGYMSVPVLLNDFDPNGIPLTVTGVQLDDKVALQGPPGTVFIQANQLRYVPPTASARPGPFTATGTYTVSNGRDRANGRFTIEVTDPRQNRPPSPAPVELRTFADQPVTFVLPSYGLDPDGDPVELLAIVGAPAKRGTVAAAENGASFTYTPLPGRTGTDRFRWQLRDSYDAVGYLDVRVVVSPASADNHPPVAVRDTAQVVAGQSVHVPALANDTDPDPADTVVLVDERPFDQPNVGAGRVTGASDDGFLAYEAPDVEGEYSFLYYITDGESPPVPGLVTVTVTTAENIVNRPPVVKDIVLKPAREGERVTVDLEPYASDPEGAPLTFGPGTDAEAVGASVEGSVLSVTMTREPMIFTFVADDGAEADFSSTGVIQIPVPKNRAPEAEVLAVEIAAEESTKTIDIPPSAFSDPDGDPVAIYVESKPTIEPPEATGGGDMRWDGNSFVLNRAPDFGGTATITYYIVDDPSVGEPIIQPATIVLTVLEEDNTPPVVRETTTEVVSGSTSQFDLRSIVTDEDPADEANLTISDIRWSGPTGVTMKASGTVVTFTADIDAAKEGESIAAAVTFGVDDGRADGRVDGQLNVTVNPTNLGEPIAVDDLQDAVRQGESPTWNLLGNDPPNGTGQGRVADYQIVSTTQPALGSVALAGTDSVRFAPSPDASGQDSFEYTIEDRAGRQATATVRFAVHDRPAVPTQPTVGEQLSATAVVSFARPDDRGAPIDLYEVQGSPGGATSCDASPCTVSGLTNGVEYTFRVRAYNEVGWSDWSAPSAPYTPDELPGTPPTPQADWGDQGATVAWGAIPNDGSAVIDVTVSATPADRPPIVFSGGQGGGQVTFTGLTNGTAYTFTIVARNKKGDSPRSPSSIAVVPAGPPSFASAPSFYADNGFVVASWSPANGNGDDDLTYTVRLTDESAGSTTNFPVGATLTQNLPAVNGHRYYAVINASNKYTARFAPAGVDGPRSVSDTAIGIPTAPGSVTASAGPGNGAISLSWSAADPQGGTITGYQVSTNGGAWNDVGTGLSTSFSSGLSLGATYSFQVRALNNNRQGVPGNASNSSSPASPYTPPAAPSVSCGTSGNTVVCNWSANALNGPAPQTVLVNGGTAPASGSWSSGDIGYSQTGSITVRVCNGGTAGNNCSERSASATTPPPPQPSIGVSSRVGACEFGPTCLILGFSISNFTNSPRTYTCIFSDGFRRSFNFSGTNVNTACYTAERPDGIRVEIAGQYGVVSSSWISW